MAAPSNLANWVSAISQLVFMIIFVLLFLGFNQKFQVYIWSRNIKMKLAILENMANESKRKTIDYIKSLGFSNPEKIVDDIVEFFLIQPVDIEPTDIIRRLENILRTREERIEGIVERMLSGVSKFEQSIVETALEITAALYMVFKIVRHYLLVGQKTNNWILIMQLEMLMPQIMRQAQTYKKALDVFLEGKPIGDGVGPLTAFRLVGLGKEAKEIAKDTVYYEVEVEGRRVYVIKAKGPQSNVGHPGVAVEKLAKELEKNNIKVGMIITVDAALKLEGEETGVIAEGVGAAIGDPGPEKIRIERVASARKIPLYALIVKMSMEEALLEMKKEISEAVDKVVERIKELVKLVPENEAVIVAGIGNTIGIS